MVIKKLQELQTQNPAIFMIGKTVNYLAEHKYIVYALFIFITIITLLLTLLPPDELQGRRIFEYDKIGHFLIFFGWTFMFGFSWILHKKTIAPLFLIFLAGSLFGTSIEIAQCLMPYERTFSIWDVVTDVIGSFTAVILLWMIQVKHLSFISPYLSKK